MSTAPTSHSTAPKVVIDEMVYQKIMHWVNKSQYEVSGLGKVVVENGVVRVVSAHLLPQKNSHTTTDIEGADVGKLMFLTKDEPGELRFWWHSHVNMQVFWSGTDMATINELGANGWFVHTVFNKRQETRTAISMGDPFPAIIDNIQLYREIDTSELALNWDKEYEDKVTNVVPKSKPALVQRFPLSHRSSQAPVSFSKEEREELARLAQMMHSEDEDNLNFPGLGSDGVYGDYDPRSSGSQDSSSESRTKEHDKGDGTVGAVLKRRDTLEDKVEKYEDRLRELTIAKARIPAKLALALEQCQEELNEVDEELDTLQQHGMLSDDDRYAGQYGRIQQ